MKQLIPLVGTGSFSGENQLTGPIPTEIGKLDDLLWLELCKHIFRLFQRARIKQRPYTNCWHYSTSGDNQLTGPIPKELGELADLGILDLGKHTLQ